VEYIFDLLILVTVIASSEVEKLVLHDGIDCKTPVFEKDKASVILPVNCNMTIETNIPILPPLLTIKHQKQKKSVILPYFL
jgi:hypothetical protein